MWRNLHNLPLTAQSFRDSQDKSFAFHGASFAAWAKAPAVPLDWPISAVASAIDQGKPAGRWSACRPFYRSGDAVAEIAGEEGASEPAADPRQPAKRFSRGQSRIPEPRGAHAAKRRMRHRPAAPPDAWVGLAAEPAEAGGRPPIGEPLLRGPAGGLDGGVVARVALAERDLRTSSASGRPPMSGFANPPPPNPDPPRFRRRLLRRLRAAVFPGPIGPFELGGAEAAKRRTRPRPVADRLDAPERVRRGLLARGAGARERPGLAMPMRDGGALSARALEWGRRVRANEKGAPARADAPE